MLVLSAPPARSDIRCSLGWWRRASLRIELAEVVRASTQNLAFPADAERYVRGGLLALSANGLYLAGAVAIGAAAVLMVLE